MSKYPATKVKLKPADPFELVRWLARSQNDPRKAVAELVQNSLDANAKHVRIARRRLKGVPALIIEDDGQGVIPEMGREEALRYLAGHVGHSRKLGLSPSERRERVVAGQYGVGLLGFWSLGRRLEMRTRVSGSDLYALRLVEDNPNAEIGRIPARLDALATYTEIVVWELNPTAQRALLGRRITDYLGAELRGQLLQRDVELTVFDGMTRGSAQKHFAVVPRRFLGEQLPLPPQIPVEGFEPARVELYLSEGSERPAIQVSCAGTLVADDIGELASLGLGEPPWVGRSLSGIIDFSGFTVPPGTRRGVVPNVAAAAFAQALDGAKPLVEQQLAKLEAERTEAAERNVVRDLRKALKGLRKRLPQYDVPFIDAERAAPAGGVAPGPGAALPEPSAPTAGEAPVVELFPPGPLASVRIEPAVITVVPGAEHRVRGVAEDAHSRPLSDGLTWTWSLKAPGLTVRGEGPRPAVCAAPGARLGTSAPLRLTLKDGAHVLTATAEVTVSEAKDDEAARFGIPEPQMVSDPGGLWRSRMTGNTWEVNQSHEDYVALRAEPRARVRYLLALFAKEIVHRSYGTPGTDELLEKMAEILAHVERNLRGA